MPMSNDSKINIATFIDFREALLEEYKDKIINIGTLTKYANAITFNDMERGLDDSNRRFFVYNYIILTYKDNSSEVLSLYDKYREYLNI